MIYSTPMAVSAETMAAITAKRVPEYHGTNPPNALVDMIKGINAYYHDLFRASHLNFLLSLDPHSKAEILSTTLEQLHAIGLITEGSFLFNSLGNLNPELTNADLEKAKNEKLLSGVSILNIGGVEAIYLYHLGAKVVCVNPQFAGTGLPDRGDENIWFIPERLDRNIIPTLRKIMGNADFDAVISRLVISFGARMDQHSRSGDPFDPYINCFSASLEVTKPGGIHVHSGDLVPLVIDRLPQKPEIKLARLNSSMSVYGWHDLDTFVLQKPQVQVPQ